ncbi:MAG: hypothetical protein ACPGSB_11240 [Opitutales bacterium]
MKTCRYDFLIPHYGATSFLAPKLNRLYIASRKSTDGNKHNRLKRSEMDAFLRLSGQLLAQNEQVDEMTHRFGDDTVPPFSNETEEVKRRLFALCAENTDDPISDDLVHILHLLGKSGVRLSQAMADALLQCLRIEPDFTRTVLRKIPRYIKDSIDSRLPLRIFYLRLGQYSADDFRIIAAYCDQTIAAKSKVLEKLDFKLLIVDACHKENIERQLKDTRRTIDNLKSTKSAALEAVDFLESRRKPLRHNSPVLQIFLERLEGKERSKALYNLISKFEEEDAFLDSMGYYPGQPIGSGQRSYPKSNTTSFLPHRRRDGLIIPKYKEDWRVDKKSPPTVVLGDILGIETATATFSIRRQKRMSRKS